jgi:hypothetical protein
MLSKTGTRLLGCKCCQTSMLCRFHERGVVSDVATLGPAPDVGSVDLWESRPSASFCISERGPDFLLVPLQTLTPRI